MKRKRLIRIGMYNSLYLISFKTIAFSEGAIMAFKKKKVKNSDERKIPNPQSIIKDDVMILISINV
jgi:hypothetical protein